MQVSGPETGTGPYTFVDRPKTSLKVVSVVVWIVTAFLMYKALVEPPEERWAVFMMFAVFCACSYAVMHEFLLRPTRQTTIHPLQRRVVVQETSWGRNRELVRSIAPDTRFEIFECDSDNSAAYGVRVKAMENGWLTVAEFLSKTHAERLMREAIRTLLDPQ